MYNQITITPTELVVSPAGLDRLWALKGPIRVPWRHVTGIFRDQGAFKEHKGLRLPGTAIPGLYYAGSFFCDGQRRFYNVRRNTPIVVITLINEGYDRLILSVENPTTVIERVTGHLLNKA